MLVKTLSGKLHFVGEDEKTICGLGIRESWSSSDTIMFEAGDVCEKCQELFDEQEDEFFEEITRLEEASLGDIEEFNKGLDKNEPAKGFKI